MRALLLVGGWTGDDEAERAGVELARRAGFDDYLGMAAIGLAASALDEQRYEDAERVLAESLAFCMSAGSNATGVYLLELQARLELVRDRLGGGRPKQPSSCSGRRRRRLRRESVPSRFSACSAPDAGTRRLALLDEARALAESTETLMNRGPVTLARAEAAMLAGDLERLDAETQPVFAEAVERGFSSLAGQLAVWRRRAGHDEPPPPRLPEPDAVELAGHSEQAANLWETLDCRYEAALALAWADDDALLLRAFGDLQQLGAAVPRDSWRAAFASAASRPPRGPRPATRDNPAGLTAREIEVLRLLADGHTNPTIAQRLYVSPRTVDRHVSSLMRKLDTRTRGQAVASARRLGAIEDR